MRIQTRGEVYKTPRVVFARKADENGERRKYYIQKVTLEGETLEFFGNEDLTLSFNGERELLDQGGALTCDVLLELEARDGKPTVNLLDLVPVKAKA